MIRQAVKKLAMRISQEALPCGSVIPTIEELHSQYRPAKTFGASADVQVAMDGKLESFGLYSKLQEMFDMGMGSAMPPQFLGYSFLSGLTQNGLIRAGVETLADEMASGWVELARIGDADSHGSFTADEDRISLLQREIEKFHLKEIFHKGAEFCGYFGGGLVYIDTGETDIEALKTPLKLDPATFRSGCLRGFIPVEPINVYPGLYNSSDPLHPDYFRPCTWWVMGKEVHESRFLKFEINEPPMLLKPAYNFFGISTAQLAVDYVAHFTEDRESASRLLKKFSLTVFKTNMSGLMYGGSRENFDRRMRIFTDTRNNDATQAVDKEDEDIVQINTPIGGVTDIVRQALELMAVVFRMPAVKLLGISPAGFNATGLSDMDNWHEHALSQESKMWKKPLDKALQVLQLNAFGDIDRSISFNFCEIGRRDENGRATINKAKADTDAVYMDRGVLSAEEVRARLVADPDSGYNDINADEMPDIQGDPAITQDWDPFAMDGEFNEGKIKRAPDGKFGNGGGSSETSEPFGTAFKELSGKPKEAIDKLLKEKGGHVPAAVHKEGIGDIDFVYGEAGAAGSKGGYGLAHIVRRRNEEGNDGEAFVKELPEIIKNGKVYKREDHPNRAYIESGNRETSIRLEYDGKERNWLVSAYIKKP